MSTAIVRRVFFTILLCYVVAGALYTRYTPAWQLPDEPAHYNYIRQVAEAGCCPVIEAGDWSSDYLSQLTSSRFAPESLGKLNSIQYEDHHPPLYYLLASPVYAQSDGALVSLRVFSLVLGAGVVVLSFLIGQHILPHKPQTALAATALVAFLPQHLHMMSAVNNDVLAELLIALACALAVALFAIRHRPGLAAGTTCRAGISYKAHNLLSGAADRALRSG